MGRVSDHPQKSDGLKEGEAALGVVLREEGREGGRGGLDEGGVSDYPQKGDGLEEGKAALGMVLREGGRKGGKEGGNDARQRKERNVH